MGFQFNLQKYSQHYGMVGKRAILIISTIQHAMAGMVRKRN
jgi:hypothetical protein